MSAWRHEAIKHLPQFRDTIETSERPIDLWLELWFEFKAAYVQDPINTQVIAGVYAYAIWCWQGSDFKGNHLDLISAVFYYFFEGLAGEVAIRQDMANWLCLLEFEVLLEGPLSYGLNREECKSMETEFRHAKKKRGDAGIERCPKLQIRVSKPLA